MKKIISILIFISFINCQANSIQKAFIDENNSLAIKFMSQITKPNYVFSPYLLYESLAMIYVASESEKLTSEILNVVEFSKDKSKVIESFFLSNKNFGFTSPLLLKRDSSFEIHSSVWIDEKYKIDPEFSMSLKHGFDATICNFETKDAIKSAKIMNDWISKSSDGKFKNIISPSDFKHFQPLSVFIFNVASFKEKWLIPFHKHKTKKGDFYLPNKKCVNLEFMNNKSHEYTFYKNDKYESCKIPYQNNCYSIIFIKPIDKVNIEDFTYMDFEDIFTNLNCNSHYFVNIYIPKLKIDSSLDFNESLKTLGLKSFFYEYMPCFYIGESLKLGSVKSVSNLNIFEEGTEVTSLVEIRLSTYSTGDTQKPYEIDFKLDRSFFFFIIDESTEIILFTGKITNPTLENLDK